MPEDYFFCHQEMWCVHLFISFAQKLQAILMMLLEKCNHMNKMREKEKEWGEGKDKDKKM